MTKLTTSQIRSTFLNYFIKNEHTHVVASSLVPKNDPTLMFTNSGMVQFKDVFTSLDQRNYSKATSSQKCVRAGGKHNDLNNVGYTARHHTFFEMLGNFSFGDYFKEEAIYYAWTLLTKEFSLSKEKLYVTVFHEDEEAITYWKKIANLGDDKIIRISTNDNFWSMGDLGPCGPSSEIFYDHGDKVFGSLPGTKDANGDRYIEIWNLVFMQFEQINKDTKKKLSKKSVDTGMGLERISAIMQGVHNNYDIDTFQEIIGYAESILKVKAQEEALFSYRIIADHLRSSAFLIADGVMPSNEGRGYVLRKIMRRAMRYADQLGASEPLMYRLLPKLIDLFGSTFFEITRAEDLITSVLKEEEEKFKVMLGRGLKILEDKTKSLSSKSELSGEVAFKLYDTYGFPLDLTEEILKKKNITVNKASFKLIMNQQKQRARSNSSGIGGVKTDDIWFNILSKFGSTKFLGYSLNSSEAKVFAIIIGDKRVKQISETNKKFTLITNQTPFYGESGGQMGDVGFITSEGCRIKVLNTLKYLGKIHGHICEIEEGCIKEDDVIKLTINMCYRNGLRIHHSATHILYATLRKTLGNHIIQKGSLVAYNRLRFDISHSVSLTPGELNLIEDGVNQIITNNSVVNTKLMSIESAIKSGAMALFGEKYGNKVRVVSIGNKVNSGAHYPYSIELCGGSHVSRTGDIGTFKIISESAVASGVRRIEAVCGIYAISFIRSNEGILENIATTLKTNKHNALQKIGLLIDSKKLLEKDLEKQQIENLLLSKKEAKKTAKSINNIKLMYNQLNNVDIKLLRVFGQNAIQDKNSLILVYTSKDENRVYVLIAVSKNIMKEYNAAHIIKELSILLNGTGGGQSHLAQASTQDLTKFLLIEKEITRIIKSKDF